MDAMDAMDAMDPLHDLHHLDPRRLYSESSDLPPSAQALRRQYARRAVAFALPLEGAVALILVALGRSLVLLGLVDGLDEVCGCLGLFTGALITLCAWSIGSLYGRMRYRREVSAWRERHRLSLE